MRTSPCGGVACSFGYRVIHKVIEECICTSKMYIPFIQAYGWVYESAPRYHLKVTRFSSPPPLDWAIDSETELTPLESVLVLLEKLGEECHISVEITEELKRRIKEAVRMTFSSPVDTNFSGDGSHFF